MSSPRRVTIASVIEEKKRLSTLSAQSSRTSAQSYQSHRSHQTQQTHISSNTFGKLPEPIEFVSEVTEVTRRALPSPRTVMFERPLPPPPHAQRTPLAAPPSAYRSINKANAPTPRAVELPTPVQSRTKPALSKAKSKSRVWGFLGKKIKGKEDESGMSAVHSLFLAY